MPWDLSGWKKKLFGGNVGVSPYPDAILRGAARKQLSVPQLGYNPTPSQVWGKASRMAGPTRDVSVPGMFKNPLGKMSPEELKDFKETMAEMDFGVDQEFLAGGNFGRTQEYGALPYSFDESSMSEMQKRKKLFPFLA